jgi:hypothetical protein
LRVRASCDTARAHACACGGGQGAGRRCVTHARARRRGARRDVDAQVLVVRQVGNVSPCGCVQALPRHHHGGQVHHVRPHLGRPRTQGAGQEAVPLLRRRTWGPDVVVLEGGGVHTVGAGGGGEGGKWWETGDAGCACVCVSGVGEGGATRSPPVVCVSGSGCRSTHVQRGLPHGSVSHRGNERRPGKVEGNVIGGVNRHHARRVRLVHVKQRVCQRKVRGGGKGPKGGGRARKEQETVPCSAHPCALAIAPSTHASCASHGSCERRPTLGTRTAADTLRWVTFWVVHHQRHHPAVAEPNAQGDVTKVAHLPAARVHHATRKAGLHASGTTGVRGGGGRGWEQASRDDGNGPTKVRACAARDPRTVAYMMGAGAGTELGAAARTAGAVALQGGDGGCVRYARDG